MKFRSLKDLQEAIEGNMSWIICHSIHDPRCRRPGVAKERMAADLELDIMPSPVHTGDFVFVLFDRRRGENFVVMTGAEKEIASFLKAATILHEGPGEDPWWLWDLWDFPFPEVENLSVTDLLKLLKQQIGLKNDGNI